MSTQIAMPKTANEITAEWLTATTAWHITEVAVTEIGAGLGISSAVFRANLTGRDCPPSVVVKLTAADEAAAFTCTVLSMYRREVKFYEQLGPSAPVRVPVGYYGIVSDDGAECALVIEDMVGNRTIDQIAGMEVVDADRAIDALARWHAQWWGKSAPFVASGAAVALGDPMYPAMLPGLFDEGWAKLTSSTNCKPPESLSEIGPVFGATLPGLLQRLNQDPATVLHGDFRADNMLFADDGTLILVDFQLIGTGSGAYDLAYLITQSLDDQTASGHEVRLFERWKSGLVAAGVAESDLADTWQAYRTAALFCLVYPVVAARGMDLADPRQAGLVNSMMSRMARAAVDLNVAELC